MKMKIFFFVLLNLIPLAASLSEVNDTTFSHPESTVLPHSGISTEVLTNDTYLDTVTLPDTTETGNFIQHTSVSPTTTKNGDDIATDPCSNFGFCNSTKSVEKHFCRCDEKCHEYMDCCQEQQVIPSKKTYYSPYLQCYKISSLKYNNDAYIVVGTCPESETNLTVINACDTDDVETVGPCVVNNNVIFRNRFCAECHNVISYVSCDVIFYGIDTALVPRNLSRSEKLRYFFKNKSHLRVIPPEGVPMRTCVLGLISNGETLCLSYINPIYRWIQGTKFAYRNYFCAPLDIRDTFYCLRFIPQGMGDGFLHAMTVMFSFYDKVPRETESSEECTAIWTEERPENNECFGLETYRNYATTLKSFYIIPNKAMGNGDLITVAVICTWTLETGNVTTMNPTLQILEMDNETIAHLQIQMTTIKRSFLHEIRRSEENINDLHWKLIITDGSKDEVISIVTKEHNLPQHFKNASTGSMDSNVKVIYNRNILYYLNMHKEAASLQTINNGCRSLVVYVQRATTMLMHVKSVLCNQYYGDRTNTVTIITVKALMTYICFSVSVMALLILTIINRKLRLCFTVAGSNTENLSVALIASNVLFMTGSFVTNIESLCYTIGVLLHYLWLSVFSFMSITVLFIGHNLMKMENINISDKKTRSNRRTLTGVGLLVPLIFVCPTIFLDQYYVPNLSAGYGKEVCFPNQYPANLIFFSGPIIVSLFANFVCLTIVIGKVCRLRFENEHLIKSPPFQEAKIFFRFVIVSGMFWVTIVLAAILESDWAEYVFILLCGLQGFFIAISNLTSKKMINKIKSASSHSSTGVTRSSKTR